MAEWGYVLRAPKGVAAALEANNFNDEVSTSQHFAS